MMPEVGQPRLVGSYPRLLTLKSAWPLWISLAICIPTVLGIFAWDLYRTWVVNDGVYDNGFDLSTLIVDLEVRNANMKVDALRPLTDPEVMKPEVLAAKRRKFMVERDRVIGVVIHGQARAYPLRILNWHEIVNDELGGDLIAVTYCPLTDTPVVFDRRVNGEELNFRMSGLLLHSNLLMYDPRLDFDERSLWSQVEGRAISGPAGARGARLTRISSALMPYSAWKQLHPDTTVIDGRHQLFKKCYRKNPYVPYFQIMTPPEEFFPVEQLPNSGPPPMTKVLSVRVGDTTRDFPYPEIATQCANSYSAESEWRTEVNGVPITLHYQATPACAWISADQGAQLQVEHGLWFALHAKRQADTP